MTTTHFKKILKLLFCLLTAACLLYALSSFYLYHVLSSIDPEKSNNKPNEFVIKSDYWKANTNEYLIDNYETIFFCPRGDKRLLEGWFIRSKDSDKVVIVVHGLNSSKASEKCLVVAKMLQGQGFNVLLFDMREHGRSFVDNRKTALGLEEYNDILGAFDYLLSKGFISKKIGITGASLGAVTMIIAAGEESAIHSIFLDSPFSDHLFMIKEELKNKHYPSFLAFGGLFIAKHFYNQDFLEKTIKDSILESKLTHVFLTHRSEDDRINILHSRRLKEIFESTNTNFEYWEVEGKGHVNTQLDSPLEYEKKLGDFFHKSLD